MYTSIDSSVCIYQYRWMTICLVFFIYWLLPTDTRTQKKENNQQKPISKQWSHCRRCKGVKTFMRYPREQTIILPRIWFYCKWWLVLNIGNGHNVQTNFIIGLFFLRFFDLNASAFHAHHSMAMISNHKSHLQRQKSKVSPPMFFPPLQFIQKGQCWNLSIQTKAILFNRRASNAKYISFLLNKLSILSSEKKYNIYHIYQEEKCAADVFQLAPFLSKLWKW